MTEDRGAVGGVELAAHACACDILNVCAIVGIAKIDDGIAELDEITELDGVTELDGIASVAEVSIGAIQGVTSARHDGVNGASYVGGSKDEVGVGKVGNIDVIGIGVHCCGGSDSGFEFCVGKSWDSG